MWPFKKKHDIVSKRLLGHDCDISFIYSRLSQHERFMNYELLDFVHKLDKRIDKLEKDNKKLQQLLTGSNKNLVITITDCNKY